MPEPYPENVGGDFYVKKDCCLCCDVPLAEAPALFTYADDGDSLTHCFVSKQPTDDSELNDMLRVISYADMACIHYRGNDPTIIQRLTDMGESDACDALATKPPKTTRPWWRLWRFASE